MRTSLLRLHREGCVTLGLAILICAGSLIAGTAAAVSYLVAFPLQPQRGPLPPLTAEQGASARRLERHVRAIAATPRNLHHYVALERAAQYVEDELQRQGHVVQLQHFEADGLPVRNIEVVVDGRHPDAPTLIVGAHYDSAEDSPGANDNGSGVAALLELARGLRAGAPPNHRMRLVFFVNEEQPYSRTEHMGSLRHARRLAQSGERITGMIALETLGYFSDAPGSQRFPFPFGLIYPDVGNFVAFVGLPRARPLVWRLLKGFRTATRFPSIGGVAPAFVPGVALSDHWAYNEVAIPALMLTDTAPFRNPHYHMRDDLPETVDYDSLARITHGLETTLRTLAD